LAALPVIHRLIGVETSRRVENVTPTIVVAEDDDELRELIADLLEDSGYDVIPAANGKQVTDYLESADQPPAAIVLDLLMPLVSGWEVLRRLRSRPLWTDIPVVAVTGLSRDRPPGVTAVLKKPFPVRDLLSILEKASSRCK
jgi:CheY-like chemotaxis protein